MHDRYEVFATHGRGVFSSVLRARDRLRKDGEGAVAEVAIKVIRANETMTKARAPSYTFSSFGFAEYSPPFLSHHRGREHRRFPLWAFSSRTRSLVDWPIWTFANSSLCECNPWVQYFGALCRVRSCCTCLHSTHRA